MLKPHQHPYENLDTHDTNEGTARDTAGLTATNSQYSSSSSSSSSSSTEARSSRLSSNSLHLLNGNPDRFRAVALFSICTILLFADQNLMAPNLTAIGNEFGFTAQERDQKLGGDISFAFFLLGAPASIVIGCLADHYNRTKLFAWTVGVGEGACLLTYWSTSYEQLYVLRAVTGFSLGGAFPLIYSILGDLFPADKRHTVSAIVSIGTGVGTSLGQGISGFLGPTFGWRLPFLVPSIPALMCALAVGLMLEDPERGAMEAAIAGRHRVDDVAPQPSGLTSQSIEITSLEIDDAHCSDDDEIVASESHIDLWKQWSALRALLSTSTVLLALIQGGPGCVPWGVVGTYLNDFLSENRGMSVERATFVLLVFGFGNFLGMLLGGGGGTYLYRIDRRYPALLAGFSAILACFPFWVLLNHVDVSSKTWFVLLVSVISGLTCAVTGPIIKAQLQNVTLPQTRGVAFSLFNLGDDFGKGLGPVFVAALITMMGTRTRAFNAAVFGWALCGLLNLAIFFTIERDERMVQIRLAAASFPADSQVDVASLHDEDGLRATRTNEDHQETPKTVRSRRRSS